MKNDHRENGMVVGGGGGVLKKLSMSQFRQVTFRERNAAHGGMCRNVSTQSEK